MARSRNIVPNPNVPMSVVAMKDRIGEAIVKRIEEDKITAAEIGRRYRSVRAGDISKIKQGDWALFGMNRLVSIAETIGLDVEIHVS